MPQDKILRKSLPLATPDFDNIKLALREFLKQQEQFTDYDFDSAEMNVVLDLLSYNTHFKAFYLNMIGNEAFLATAVRRDSVVNRARSLSYLPRSARSAVATIFIELFTTTLPVPTFIDLPKGTQFTASGADITFTFSLIDAIRINQDTEGKFLASGLEIIEGKPLTHVFDITADNLDGVVIPNPNVDTSHLVVQVDENDVLVNFETYDFVQDITDGISEDSKVYYLDEVEAGLYKVEFGDGILGKPITIGSQVRVEYFITSGESPNGVAAFTLTTAVPDVSSFEIQVESPAVGGAEIESIQQIKFSAPKNFETQNRAVTATDYPAILKQQNTNIDDIIAWGGEDNDPPKYGFTFIAINPKTGFFLTDVEKRNIIATIRRFNVTGILPIIVDADFIFVSVTTDVFYDTTQTELTAGQLETVVSDAITDYNDSSIGRFDKALRYSVLSRIIDNSELSIINNNLSLTLSKRIFPNINVEEDYIFSFNNPIVQGSFKSSKFTFNGFNDSFFEENFNIPGNINVVQVAGEVKNIIAKNVGIIDYSTGDVQITNVELDAVVQTPLFLDPITNRYFIKFFATPSEQDVNPSQRQIVEIDETTINITPLENFRQ